MHVIYIAHITYITHMIKLFFKAYKKPIKHVAVNFFLYMKMLTGHYQKTKNGLKKKARERYINLAEEEKKTRNVNVLVNDIKIFLNKKETKSVSMVVNYKEIFQKMKDKG